MKYRTIASHYTRPGRLWLWCCAQIVRLPGFWCLYRYKDGVLRGKVWLYFMSRAYTWGEIEVERRP